MDIQVKVVGIDEAIARADYAQRLFLLYVGEQLDWFGASATKEMRQGHPPGGPHPNPGEMPIFGDHRYIDRTGQLTRSIGYSVEQWNNFKAIVLVFAMAPYAEKVEQGEPNKSRPYPFFYPVFYKYLPILMARIPAAVERAFADAIKANP